MSIEEANKPLIDLEEQSPTVSIQDSDEIATDGASEVIVQSSARVTNHIRTSENAKLSLKEWIGVIMGALVIILLMAYLIYILVTGPMLLNNSRNHMNRESLHEFPDLTIVNYHPHLMIHEISSLSNQKNNTLESESKTRTNIILSEYLLKDYIIHHSKGIHDPSIHPKLVQAAKLRTIHASEGFSSSKWLSKESFKYSDLFEYDIDIDHIVKSKCLEKLKWDKIVKCIRNDSIRLERMRKHNMYGSYLTGSNLVEIWTTSEKRIF